MVQFNVLLSPLVSHPGPTSLVHLIKARHLSCFYHWCIQDRHNLQQFLHQSSGKLVRVHILLVRDLCSYQDYHFHLQRLFIPLV